jgi:hypothetical protein
VSAAQQTLSADADDQDTLSITGKNIARLNNKDDILLTLSPKSKGIVGIFAQFPL